MPHTFRAYRTLRAAGYSEQKALAIVSSIDHGRDPAVRFDRDSVEDSLRESGFSEVAAEACAGVIKHCFASEAARAVFNRGGLKTNLVRSGLSGQEAEQFLAGVEPCVLTPRTGDIRKSIKHAPTAGRVVMCDFNHLRKPEMIKERRAIVVSSRSNHASRRCIVVPVSMSPPRADNAPYYEFAPGIYPFFHPTSPVWAVCDHVYTTSLERVWHVNVNHRPVLPSISPEHLSDVRRLLAKVLGYCLDSQSNFGS